jgi:predicted nucleic acid-binding protein
MDKIFADTSGWANFFVRSEPYYEQAMTKMRQWHDKKARLVTSNYVLTELVALMTSPLRIPRNQQIKVIETIKSADWVEVIHIDPSLDDEAWQLLKNRPDKLWSLVDCSSIVVMQHMGITEAFTADHHFEQAGFLLSLK